MKDERKMAQEALINLIIERFDDLEHESGQDFTHAKRVILTLAKKLDLYK